VSAGHAEQRRTFDWSGGEQGNDESRRGFPLVAADSWIGSEVRKAVRRKAAVIAKMIASQTMISIPPGRSGRTRSSEATTIADM
jgi:hypothetical protein